MGVMHLSPAAARGNHNQPQKPALEQTVPPLCAPKSQAVIFQTKGEKNTDNFFICPITDPLSKATEIIRACCSLLLMKNEVWGQPALHLKFRLQEYVDSFMPVDCLTPACSFRYSVHSCSGW